MRCVSATAGSRSAPAGVADRQGVARGKPAVRAARGHHTSPAAGRPRQRPPVTIPGQPTPRPARERPTREERMQPARLDDPQASPTERALGVALDPRGAAGSTGDAGQRAGGPSAAVVLRDTLAYLTSLHEQ